MITTCALSVFLLCFQVAADAPTTEPSQANKESEQETQQAIERAIGALDSNSFQARENAVKELWRIGEPAKAALEKVAEEGSLEARRRAIGILEDIELGITPDATIAQSTVLRKFQSSSQAQRAGILSEMLKKGEMDLVAKMIGRIDDLNVKRSLFQQSFNSTAIMVELIQTRKLEWWVQKASESDATLGRHQIITDWLGQNDALRQLRDDDKLSIVEALFAQEPHDASRFALAKTLMASKAFCDIFASETNVDLLLRLVDLPTNASGTNELLLTMIRDADASTICQAATFRKIMRFVNAKASEASASEIKVAFLNRFSSSAAIAKQLSTDTFIELCSGLTPADFDRSFDAAIGQSAIALWMLEVDNLRPLLDWAKGLPATTRDQFILHLAKLIGTKQSAADGALNDPLTLEVYWQLVDAIANEDAKRNAKFMLAVVLASESNFRSDQRKDVTQLILTTQSPAADAALITMLRNTNYRERIFEQGDDVKSHLNRCAEIDLTTSERLLIEAYQSIFHTNVLRRFFAEPSSSDWVLKDYLPSLPNSKRGVAINAICNSEALLQTWKEKPAIGALLDLATELADPIARATCIASILRHEQFVEIEEDDPKLRLLEIYRDESLPDAARAEFIRRLATNQNYLEWLGRNDQVSDFIESVESLAAKPDADLSSLIFSIGYVNFIAKQNHLESWLTGLEGDSVAESRALSILVHQQTLLTPDFLDRNMDRLIRIANLIEDSYQRSNYLAMIMLSPNAILLHQRKQNLGNLLKQIGDEEDLQFQDKLLESLAKPEVMKVLGESEELDTLIEMIKDLPLKGGPSALAMLSHPILLKHLGDTGQVDFLFEMVTRSPDRSRLESNRMVIDMLISHGYVDRLLENAENSKDREALTARLVGSRDAIAFYNKKGRLMELVNLFERLEPGMNRDSAVMSLFGKPELAISVCEEIGVERSMALVNTIQYPFYLASTRANTLIASCEIEKLPEPSLQQLLVDIQSNGVVSLSRCQVLLQGAAGEQLIAAGLLPQIKEMFLKARRPGEKRIDKPLDQFYSSVLVIRHLNASGQMEEFLRHAKSITQPQDVAAFALRLIDSEEGCRIQLSSKRFTDFTSIIETMSEYSQSHFWRSFCANKWVIHYVSYSGDIDAMFGYLIERKQSASEIEGLIVQIAQAKQLDEIFKNRALVSHIVASLPKINTTARNSLASHLSRHSSAIWMMIETGQWDAFVAIIDSGKNDQWPKTHWNTCAGYQGGLISALISMDQYDKVAEVLQKSSESDWHLAWTDLWLRVSRGTIDDDIKRAEANSETLKEGQWRWQSWAQRAQGNNAKATEAAIKANDHSFQTALAIERADWPEVVSLLNKVAAPQGYIQPRAGDESELEHQAMLLVARLYAQQDDQLQEPVDAIANLRSATDNPRLRSRCCDALLLGQQFESTLSFLDQQMSHRALRLRLHQGKYAEAIEAVKWDPLDPQAFLTNIRTSTGNDRDATESTIDLLRVLSRDQRHDDMRLLHEAVIDSQPKNIIGLQPNHQIINYAKLLYRYELFDLFWPTLDYVDLPPLLHSAVFDGDSQDEVKRTLRYYTPRLVHWATDRQVDTNEMQAAIGALRVADEAIRLNSVPKHQLDTWVDKLTQASETGNQRSEEILAAGIICLRQGRIEDAMRILMPLENTHSVASLALARDAWQRKDWDQAAVHYDRLYRKARARIDAMYLSGLAISRSGKVDEGGEVMAKAIKIAFHPRTFLQLGIELLELGEAELGKEFLQKVVRLVLPHDPAQMEAIGHLKASASSPEEVIKWGQQWQMLQTRYVYGNGDQTEFLQVPWTMQNALAERAFSNEDWPAVDRALKVCHEIKPRETAFFNEWMERLNRAGQTDLATVWKEKVGAQTAPTH